jgi:hypothetical protein
MSVSSLMTADTKPYMLKKASCHGNIPGLTVSNTVPKAKMTANS